MKRDMQLVRKLLLELEKRDHIIATSDMMVIEGEDHDPWTIEYHLSILADSEFVAAVYSNSGHISHYRLTWQGHEFIDAVRDDTIWRKVTEALQKLGGHTYPMLLNFAERLLLARADEILKSLGP